MTLLPFYVQLYYIHNVRYVGNAYSVVPLDITRSIFSKSLTKDTI